VDKSHPLRSRAKIVNFGVLYGKDAYGLAMELGIPKKEAQQLVDAILGKFKKLAKWIENQLRLGRATGWTRTWWDGADARYRPLIAMGGFDDDARKSAERSTWNTSIQGTATEFTNASLGAIQKWIEDEKLPAKLVLTVYDSIVAEVRGDVVDDYIYGAKKIMEGWPSGGIPIVSDFKRGFAWGSLEDVKH
jgi:DNA polymerase-1